MSWRSPKLWITVCSLLAVSMVAIVDTRRTSPGPIAGVHAQLDEIDGGNSCSQCHGGWFSDMTSACLDCHAVIGEQIESRRGVHGIPNKALADNCAACHGDHHGANFALVNDRAFRGIGAKSKAEFDHNAIGFEMNGRHAEIGCVDCHEHAEASLLPEGAKRFQGLSQACGSCHEDPHEGRMQVSCASCHGQTQWDQLHSQGHERFLPLIGGHGDVGCRQCHAESDAHSLESMGDTGARLAARECSACHASPHSDPFVIQVAQAVAKPSGASCVVCHSAEHTLFREPSLKISAEQHAFTGYRLDAPHDAPLCADCHDPRLQQFSERYPGRSPDACSACHADPHGGQFATGPYAAQECTACHARAHFVPNTFTAEQHALSKLVLDGKHATTQCNDCHTKPAEDAPRVFQGTAAECAACHRDAHGGFFEDSLTPEELPDHGSCAACHTTTTFAEIPAPGFDHLRFTDFAILGAHAQSECASCHPSAAAPDESGRTFGRVEEHFGAFTGCITCHTDPHQGRFDTPSSPREVEGRTDCARCHDESSFRAFPRGFDHGRWTGFQLVGAHGRVSCSSCHEPLHAPDSVGRTWQAALGNKCSDCHFDPHAGQFEARGANSCAQCHSDALENFIAFNHDRDSRFPLREQHAEIACSACHKPWVSASGEEVVRFRPLGTECVDCHGVQEDVLMRRKRRSR
ncbi:MAG: hypothetical protein JNL28_00500 [Planctomycetes bacterium]|nr:hypothetical protein [Planctomycetota bacterium]